MNIMPTHGILVSKKDIVVEDSGVKHISACVSIKGELHWGRAFSYTAEYLSNSDIGSHVFIEDWVLEKNKSYYNIIFKKLICVKKGD